MAPKVTVGEVVYNAAVIVQRQTASSSPGAFTLSLGAIIGIACGGGVLVFGILTWILVACARRKNKRLKKATARQSLDDDTTVGEAMRSTRPPEVDLTRKSAENPFKDPARTPTLGNKKVISEKESTDSMSQLLRPPSNNRANDFHNSWPFVSHGEGRFPPESQAPIILRMPEPTVPLDFNDQVYDPIRSPPAQKRPEVREILSDIRPKTILLEKPIIEKQNSPPRRNTHHRSVSEGHLNQILSSVDQRLQYPKVSPNRKPMPRAVSILSQMSGQPPALKLPTPELDEHHPRFSQLFSQPADKEDFDAVSVKSSVLDLFSGTRTPSPEKLQEKMDLYMNTPRKASLGNSEDDSLYGDTPNEPIPKALTSPSKHSQRSEQLQRYRAESDQSPVSIRIREDSEQRTSMEAFGRSDVFKHNREKSDPFVSVDRSANVLKISTAHQGPNAALRDTSGNGSSFKLAKRSPILAQFDWSEELVIKTSPKPQQPTISKRRGHQRSKTIRLSRVDLDPRRQVNVGVLKEESESELSPVHGVAPQEFRSMTQSSSEHSRSGHTAQLPSFSHFPTLLAPPSLAQLSPTRDGKDSRPSTSQSSASYSATMSFYDYYSSTESTPNGPSGNAKDSPEKPKEGGLDRNMSARHGRDFSVGQHDNPDAFKFPTPIQPGMPGSPGKEYEASGVYRQDRGIPESFVGAATNGNGFHASQPSLSKLHGPRNLPRHVPRDSVASSIATLRRMNSQVSAYSVKSGVSDGSPTLPAMRGGGISPHSKRGPRGSRNYLSIDLDKSSPSSMRGRAIIQEHRALGQGDGSPRSQRAVVRHSETARSSQSTEIPSPDKDFYSPAARGLVSAQTTPTKSPRSEGMSSGLKIQGLRLPIRDDQGSPTKTTISPPISAFGKGPRFFRAAAEQEHNSQAGDNGQEPRWSEATPQPPANMFVSRPQSHSRLAQPVAVGIKDLTPPRWNGPGALSPTSPGFGSMGLYAPSPTYEQLTFESPTRESFELAVKDSPLQKLPDAATSETAAATTSLRTGTAGRRGAGAKGSRMDALRWEEGNRGALSSNSTVDAGGVQAPKRGSGGMYDAAGFLKSSPERGREAAVGGMENMI